MAAVGQLGPTIKPQSGSQFPCFRAVEEEGVVRSENKRYLRHRIVRLREHSGEEEEKKVGLSAQWDAVLL